MVNNRHIAGLLALFSVTACTGPSVLNTFARGPGADISITRDIAYGPSDQQQIDWYQPEGEGPFPVLIYIHGGSWDSGSRQEYGFVGRRFAGRGYLTAVIGYRLTPEGAWPAFMNDVGAAVASAYRDAALYEGNPERLFLAGHSAGGYNAVQVALAPEFLSAHALSTDIVDGVIGISAPYDFLPSDLVIVKAAFDSAPDPAATQPVNRVTSNAPPMLLLVSGNDQSVEPYNAVNMAAALRAENIPVEIKTYQGASHVDTVIAIAFPGRLPVVDDMVEFMESVSNN